MMNNYRKILIHYPILSIDDEGNDGFDDLEDSFYDWYNVREFTIVVHNSLMISHLRQVIQHYQLSLQELQTLDPLNFCSQDTHLRA